ncbi:uncharacterized protein RSE6_06147 [Rhynchosporium secalis]|uniref:Fungal N-terminal domain-containing protein n=1 Tax=Rhynchosporium secalis TaxID=38038 RepID=A0A1E1MAR1_RHYSE|nr:uncharacterized protein RSE6_06147 [Rhynchosporium secalis]
MSFGSSVGDIILLIQLAHKNYRNCKEAGGEYVEIAREVRSLHSILRTVRDEAEREDSLIFKSGSEERRDLIELADGCKGVLEGIDVLLSKYKGLAPHGVDIGKASKLWQKFRFGTEIEDLGKLRWKIITYTSTLAVLVDSINLKATERVGDIAGRIENRMGDGFTEMMDRLEGFEDMRKAVLFIATRARASQRHQAMESVLSLSTYADDDKEVWRQFRSQLVSLGFRSDSLDRHMEILKAYMMKLDGSGVLDEAVQQSGSSTLSWCGNASFRATNLSLLGTAEEQQADLEGSMEQTLETMSPGMRFSSERSPPQGQILHPQGSQAPAAQAHLPQPVLKHQISDGAQYLSVGATRQSLDQEMPDRARTTRRRRIPRIKVDEFTAQEKASDVSSLHLPLEIEISSPGTYASDTDSDVEVLLRQTSRRPAAFAESYHAVSEAGNNQLMLRMNASELKKLDVVSKRPQQLDRHISWAGPESGLVRRHYQKLTPRVEDDIDSESTDITVRDVKISSRKEKQTGRTEKMEKTAEWLDPEVSHRPVRDRANSSPRSRKPMSISNEELHLGGSWPSGESSRPSPATSKSQSNVSSVDRRARSFTAYANTSESKKEARDNVSFDYKQRRRSQSPEARINGEAVPDSKLTLAAKAAIVAGAVEAFRVRNEPGSWTGDKGKRIITAAIGAGSIGTTKDDVDSKRTAEKAVYSDSEPQSDSVLDSETID